MKKISTTILTALFALFLVAGFQNASHSQTVIGAVTTKCTAPMSMASGAPITASIAGYVYDYGTTRRCVMNISIGGGSSFQAGSATIVYFAEGAILTLTGKVFDATTGLYTNAIGTLVVESTSGEIGLAVKNSATGAYLFGTGLTPGVDEGIGEVFYTGTTTVKAPTP